MPSLSELSPFVLGVLQENHFEPVQLLRYGPRFVCLVVKTGDRTGMFKMVLPEKERLQNTPKGYVWTIDDRTEVLEERLLKETLFLQFFSQQLGRYGFEPQLIALSEDSPVWSLRTYIPNNSMSAWDSSFVFRKDFYNQVSPRQIIDFFQALHRLSPDLPEPLHRLTADYVPLTIDGRFKEAAVIARSQEQFRDRAEQIEAALRQSRPAYEEFERVITHYEPYACHLFLVNGQISLIDWENVGWGHRMHDLSILWMRMIDDPEWQAEYVRLLQEDGYFEGQGRRYWDNELMMQSLANLNHLHYGGQFGTPAFTRRAIDFFKQTVERLLNESPYFQPSDRLKERKSL